VVKPSHTFDRLSMQLRFGFGEKGSFIPSLCRAGWLRHADLFCYLCAVQFGYQYFVAAEFVELHLDAVNRKLAIAVDKSNKILQAVFQIIHQYHESEITRAQVLPHGL